MVDGTSECQACRHLVESWGRARGERLLTDLGLRSGRLRSDALECLCERLLDNTAVEVCRLSDVEKLDQYIRSQLRAVENLLASWGKERKEDTVAELCAKYGTTATPDAVQLIYDRMYNNPATHICRFGDIEQLDQYIRGAVHNALSEVRRSRLCQLRDDQADMLTAKGPEPPESVAFKEVLLFCMNHLSERDRDRFNRHYLKGDPVTIIAADQGMTESAVRTALHRVCQRLRECFEKQNAPMESWDFHGRGR
jgi:DNA-directed RNA polymerase specialized sigma24 family protein